MNRRKLIKGMAAASAIAILPSAVLAKKSPALPLHFVGLGGAGCNGVAAIHSKQVNAQFTCITSPDSKALSADVPFISFTSPVASSVLPETFLHLAPVLTTAVHQLLSQPHHFVLLAGLGGYTGTMLLQAFASLLQEKQKNFTVIASLPFRWEKARRQAVEQLLPKLQLLPGFYSFDLSELSSREGLGNVKMNLFMQHANEEFYEVYKQASTLP